MRPLRIDPEEYHREKRCPGCRLMRRLCICAELPRAGIPLELIVLQHPAEANSLSNTGLLASRVLEPARVLAEPDDQALAPPGLLLYPRPGAAPLSPDHLSGAGRLVVLDATWRRARRMFRRIDALRKLETVAVTGVEPRWILRRPPGPGRLNTAEAVAGALSALGLDEAAAALHRALDLFMPRAMHAARRIPYDDVWTSKPNS